MSSPNPRPSRPTVLVVDDEDILRRIMTRALMERGYRVLVAPDGIAAWDILQLARGSIQAVVTDVSMPNMGGLELAARVATLPDAPPVVLVSGYGQDPPTLHLPFLPKPFRPDQLGAMVAQVLGGK